MSPSLSADSMPPMPLPTTSASYFLCSVMTAAFLAGPRPDRAAAYSCM